MNLHLSKYKQLLTEDIYSSPQSRRAIKYMMREGGYSKEQAKQVIDRLMHDLEIHHSKDPKFKFMLGLSRLFVTGQLEDEQNISRMKTYLKYLSSEGHNDENKNNGYNEDINGENLQDLARKFDSLVSSDNEKSREEVNSMEYGNSDYKIVRIDSERQCRKYGKYTSWCITDGSFDNYNLDEFNQCYFCLKPNFKIIQRPENPTDAPFDEYGLSMISVIVNENGNPKYITTRYNHDYNGENNPKLCTAKQVSQLIGVNFYETFKPNNKWEELTEDCKKRLQNGENPEDIFDFCGDFREGFAKIELNDKWNFINTDGNIISKQWFDFCGDFREGFARVGLNDKCNFINTDGKIISEKWFDFCEDFIGDSAIIELNRKWNFIDKNGNYLFRQWFDDCGNFHEGFADVELNGKFYKIDKNGKLTIKENFDKRIKLQENKITHYEIPKFISSMIKGNNGTIGKNNNAIPKTEKYDSDYYLLKVFKQAYDENINDVLSLTNGKNITTDLAKDIISDLTTECQKIEAPLRPQLEKLCQNILVTLFEIPQDSVNFTCRLKEKIDDDVSVNMTPESNDRIKYEFEDLNEIKVLNKEVLKRRLIDSLIQGASFSLSSYKIYENDIQDITNDLLEKYRVIEILNNFVLFNEEKKLNERKPLENGFVHLKISTTGERAEIDSQAVMFPYLLKESIRGFMELFASHGLPNDIDKAKFILRQSDFILAEPFDLRVGIGLWKELIKNSVSSKEVPYFFQCLCQKDVKKFNLILKNIFLNTKLGHKYLKNLKDKSKHDIEYARFYTSLLQRSNDNAILSDGYMTSGELDELEL